MKIAKLIINDEALIGEQWIIDSLIPYDDNAKIHTKPQIKKIAASIKEYGWTTRIVVDEDGVIIQGHGRLKAAELLELETVPVTVRGDLTPSQVRALRLIDNKVAEGSYDTIKLAKELEELQDSMDFDMSEWFDSRELDFATADLGEIDLDALVNDINLEVAAQTEETQRNIEDEESGEFSLYKVWGFAKVNAAQQRTLALLLAHAESESGLEKADALCALFEKITKD